MVLQDLVSKFTFVTDTKPLEKVEHHLEGIQHSLHFLAAVEMVKGIWELAERFAGLGEQLETSALQAGITTSEFQRLAYAASQNAVSQESLSGALARMSRLLQHAKDGSEGAAETFEKLHISSEQIASFKNSEDAFLAVQDAISKVASTQERLSLVQEIFGRGNVKLVKLMSKGADETRRLGKEADNIGAVLGDQAVENLATFEDAVSGLGLVTRNVGASLGAMFAPMLVDVIHKLEAFWAANQKLIKTDINRWAKAAAYAFGFITEGVRILSIKFAYFVKQHPELVEEIAKVIGALLAFSLATSALSTLLGGVTGGFKDIAGAAKIGWPVLKGFFAAGRWGAGKFLLVLGTVIEKLGFFLYEWFPGLGKAMVKLGIWLWGLSANPIVLTIAGVIASLAVAVVLIHDIWALLHGKSFKETWMGQALEAVSKYGGGAWSYLKGMLGLGDQDAPSIDAGGGPPAPAIGFGDRIAGAFQYGGDGGFGIPGVGTGALQGLAASGMPLMGPPNPHDSETMSAADNLVTYNINSPITINGVAGDPDHLAAIVKKSATDVWNQGMREAQRDNAPVSRH